MENKLLKMVALGGLARFLPAAILKAPVKLAQAALEKSEYSGVIMGMSADSAFVLNGPNLLYRER
jgi:hypothetical protein